MSDAQTTKDASRKPDSRQILIVVATALLVWFAVSNWQSVTIHFWLSTTKAPVVVVIAVAAVLGAVVTRLAGRRRHVPRSKDH